MYFPDVVQVNSPVIALYVQPLISGVAVNKIGSGERAVVKACVSVFMAQR